MNVVDRFLQYVKFDTQSDELTNLTPSTPGQMIFAQHLEKELRNMGLENISLDELKTTWMAKLNDNCVFISAKQHTNIEELKSMLYEKAKIIHMNRFPYNDFLFQKYDDLGEEQ